jgi:lipopolysaccharide cholinephosphotransferase
MVNNEMQRELLEIAKIIDQICTQENISYMLYRGTLLGAVREKGFIAWDEDLDLIMHRKDFDAFALCCDEYLASKGLSLEYEGRFPVIVSAANPDLVTEIVVLDVVPKTNAKRMVQLSGLLFLSQLMLEQADYSLYKWYRKAGTFMISTLGKCMSPEAKLRAFNRISMWGNNEDGDFLFTSNESARFFNLQIPKDLVAGTTRMAFEDTELSVPIGWDGFLKLYYGKDYMIPKRDNYYVS